MNKKKNSYIKYLEYIPIVNLYIFFPISDPVVVIFHGFLITENMILIHHILIIRKIYEEHKNKIKSSIV